MSKRKKNPSLPRGPYRKNWDMPHDDPKAYKRSKAKEEYLEYINELEELESLGEYIESLKEDL